MLCFHRLHFTAVTPHRFASAIAFKIFQFSPQKWACCKNKTIYRQFTLVPLSILNSDRVQMRPKTFFHGNAATCLVFFTNLFPVLWRIFVFSWPHPNRGRAPRRPEGDSACRKRNSAILCKQSCPETTQKWFSVSQKSLNLFLRSFSKGSVTSARRTCKGSNYNQRYAVEFIQRPRIPS